MQNIRKSTWTGISFDGPAVALHCQWQFGTWGGRAAIRAAKPSVGWYLFPSFSTAIKGSSLGSGPGDGWEKLATGKWKGMGAEPTCYGVLLVLGLPLLCDACSCSLSSLQCLSGVLGGDPLWKCQPRTENISIEYNLHIIFPSEISNSVRNSQYHRESKTHTKQQPIRSPKKRSLWAELCL